jgi:hypothetical protein
MRHAMRNTAANAEWPPGPVGALVKVLLFCARLEAQAKAAALLDTRRVAQGERSSDGVELHSPEARAPARAQGSPAAARRRGQG